MPDILVRDVPHNTLDALKQRAKRNRRSLQQELLVVLEDTAERSQSRSPGHVAAAIRARLAQGDRTFSDSVELVRQDRER
ncbi:MAG: hypothetical protein Q8O86_00845 [Dehalococcoidia bacterium]|nr:hypothetical protein [Dehalococcoidia bacterium]